MALSLSSTLVALPWLLLTHPTSPPFPAEQPHIATTMNTVSTSRAAHTEAARVRHTDIAGQPASNPKATDRRVRSRSNEAASALRRRTPVASCELIRSRSQVHHIPPGAAIETVLVLGDSHAMGYFGRVLHNRLRKTFKADVTLVGACGKSEPGFLRGSYAKCGVLIRTARNRTRYPLGCRQNPCKDKHGTRCSKRNCRPKKLTTYLRTLKPDVVILQLGANSTWMGTAEDGWPKVRANIRAVVAQLKAAGTRCVWVTAPDTMIRKAETQDKFAALYENELRGQCEVFNSRPSHRPYMHYSKVVKEMKLPPSKHDMMHYWWFGKRGKRIQTRWATDIIEFTAQHFGPRAQQKVGNAQTSIRSHIANLVSRRQKRRGFVADTTHNANSRIGLRRLRENERRRTRDGNSINIQYGDDSAYFRR